MSSPIPGHTYGENENRKEYRKRIKSTMAQKMHPKEYPVQKLKRLIKESEDLRRTRPFLNFFERGMGGNPGTNLPPGHHDNE